MTEREAETPETRENRLEATWRSVLIGERWLLVAAQTTMTLLLLFTAPVSGKTVLVLAFLFLYNIASLILVRRWAAAVVQRQGFVAGLLVADLLMTGLAAFFTGASGSPFLGQCYLLIFIGALFYEIAGGFVLAVASLILTGLLVVSNPAGLWTDLRDFVPYFLVAGLFTGYLSRSVKTWFARYETVRARERERDIAREVARREMNDARRAQEATLPAAPPRIPGLDLAVRARPARMIGGDFHLLLTDATAGTNPDRLLLVVGDVTGKGVGAALTATSICHLLPWLEPLKDAEAALKNLNRDLSERLPEATFVTLALVEVDVALSPTMRFWSAGHPPCLLYRAATQAIEQTRIGNLPLGLFTEWTAESEAVSPASGDIVVLYSDGVSEARRVHDGELFGTERIGEVLARCAECTADAIADTLIKAVEAWGTINDDLTLVVAKVGASG